MKKTILALAVSGLFAATTAQAAMMYEDEGLTVDLFGDLEVNLQSDLTGTNGDDGKTPNQNYVNIDDADFGLKMGYDIGNDVKVGGVIEITGEDGSLDLDKAYVGVMTNLGTVTLGKQVTILDDAGVGGDYQFGFDTVVSDAPFDGDQVIKYKGDWDMFYAGVAYVFNDDAGVQVDNDGSAVDGNIGFRVAGLDAAVFYGDSTSAFEVDSNTMIVQAVYAFENFDIGAVWANSTSEFAGNDINDTDAVSLSANYYMNAWNFGIGAGQTDNKLATGDTESKEVTGYLNAGYAFTSNVKAYGELGYSDADDAEMGYALGMQVTF